MEAFYDVEPQKLSNINNGSYLYRINIQKIEIPALNENETITQWRCDEFVIWGIITSNKITDAVINSLWNKDYEQKLINDYNSAKEGIFDEQKANESVERYLQFLTSRKIIKEQIDNDCIELNIL